MEWLFDWLEDADPTTFKAVAASLARLPKNAGGRVLELERELPVMAAEEALSVTRRWTTNELGEQLRARFESLERRATDAVAFKEVLAAWGVSG